MFRSILIAVFFAFATQVLAEDAIVVHIKCTGAKSSTGSGVIVSDKGQNPIRRYVRRKVRQPMTITGLKHKIPDSPGSIRAIMSWPLSERPNPSQSRADGMLPGAMPVLNPVAPRTSCE